MPNRYQIIQVPGWSVNFLRIELTVPWEKRCGEPFFYLFIYLLKGRISKCIAQTFYNVNILMYTCIWMRNFRIRTPLYGPNPCNLDKCGVIHFILKYMQFDFIKKVV